MYLSREDVPCIFEKIRFMRRVVLCACALFAGMLAFSQHTVILQSGEKLKGVVMEIKHDTLMVVIKRQMTEIPLVEVSSIFFNEHVAYDGSFDPNEREKSIKSGAYTIKYVMKDRKIATPPVISNATENKGTVVDRKSTRLNSSHIPLSRMPSSA